MRSFFELTSKLFLSVSKMQDDLLCSQNGDKLKLHRKSKRLFSPDCDCEYFRRFFNCVVFDKSRKDNFEISSHFFILIRYFRAQIIFRFIRLEWFFIRSIRNSFNANKSIAAFFFFFSLNLPAVVVVVFISDIEHRPSCDK